MKQNVASPDEVTSQTRAQQKDIDRALDRIETLANDQSRRLAELIRRRQWDGG